MAALIPELEVQRVLQSVDIVDVIGSYVALKPKGKELVGLCPFHEDSNPSLNVSPSKQIYKCFACGAGGNAVSFLMMRERMSFPEAVGLLAERAGIELERTLPAPGTGNKRDLEKANRWAARFFRDVLQQPEQGSRAREYLTARGITDEIVRSFGLGYAPPQWDALVRGVQAQGPSLGDLARVGLVVPRNDGGHYDRFRDRLMFPVIDALGRIIAFGGRTLGDDPAKYLNSPESVLFDKSRTLYGIHAAKDAIVRQRTAIVVEGYTDCLMAHQCGITHTVATLGTALTGEHARMLARYAQQVVLVFDSDEAGHKAADRALDVFLGQRLQVRLVTLPQGEDPCDFLRARGADAFRDLTRTAPEALEYKWRLMQQQVAAADTIGGRAEATERFLETVAQAFLQGQVDAISEGYLLNQVAKLVEMPAVDVHRQVAILKRRGRQPARQDSLRRRPVEPLSAPERARQEVLEVLLNRPDLFETARDAVSPDGFVDAAVRQAADVIWRHLQQGGSGALAEVLAGADDVAVATTLTDLAERGQRRGNFEATLNGALQTLRHAQAEEGRQELRKLVARAAAEYGEEAETAMLADIQSKWRPSLRRPGAM